MTACWATLRRPCICSQWRPSATQAQLLIFAKAQTPKASDVSLVVTTCALLDVLASSSSGWRTQPFRPASSGLHWH